MQELLESLSTKIFEFLDLARTWLTSPQFYSQLAAIAVAVSLAFVAARLLKGRISLLKDPPTEDSRRYLHQLVYRLRDILFPLLNIFFLGVAVDIAHTAVEQSWLVRTAQGLAVVFLLYTIIARFIQSPMVQTAAKWIGIPIATLHVSGWLHPTIAYLDGISFQAGDIHISLYALVRTALFGAILFWLGRFSNNAGKQAIRSREALSVGTREVFVKVFEITVVMAVALLLLQVAGINLTNLAVFGGALGVGLGFGLQQIAANFISGFIILLDRSVTIGDYIELEDGRSGTLRELNMRYSLLETFDGKEIMVPNERFITSTFTSWTHHNHKQRYPLEFQVAYSTDLDRLFEVVRQVVASHPQVLSGDEYTKEEQPDVEIKGFGDSGIDILVEFWMDGIDDGKNRVDADLLYLIWKAIRENGMENPFPQREVRILNKEGI